MGTTYGIAAPTKPSAIYDSPGADVFTSDDTGTHIEWLAADPESWTDDDTFSYADDALAAAGYRRTAPWALGSEWIAYALAERVES